MVDHEYKNCTDEFWRWLHCVAKYSVSPKVRIEDFREINEGRCVVASEHIEKDEVLFEIPRDSILNVDTSELFKNHYEGYIDGKTVIEEIGLWETLILCLFYEMFVKKEESFWSQYFAVLPKATDFNTLMYWEDRELENLKPSFILERIGKDKSVAMHEKLMEFVEKNLDVIETSSFTWDRFLLVASIIMAYSFDIERGECDADEEEEEEEEDIERSLIKSMIPLADTLNADTKRCNANLIYDSGVLKMCAIKPIKANEQIYNTYGNHANFELLRRYGYVEVDGTLNDCGEISLTTIIDATIKYFGLNDSYKPVLQKVVNIIAESECIRELTEGEELCLDTYDLFENGEIMMEMVVMIQILCMFPQINCLDTMDKLDLENYVFRTTKLSIQLITGRSMVTKACDNVWQCALELRLKQYPIHSRREPMPVKGSVEKSELREFMAHKTLQSEFKSISNCILSIHKRFKIIPDAKLMKNIEKRKQNQNDDDNAKKRVKL
ncbi:hypothetical protein TPHA_0D02870 [Tetrapisispora phaffii CBS 4417]|uniref:Ribosomal lysine N-methyltransferase 4 n=1 Tax=Tetrapisispora phaffii (strain ATCC 24235 / CBS 4417 / NBRC 1672 / NRRL Y-8282 / UCD 70-5) TaxID=1071381 RepID=G8BSV2_TETPH|nr:hypothetical protein TPHA_0D02870 [Tetrapisispora phaffii CBS 4417]CCE62923.1 hypothetical protein TPHA_0D02870 [Tetrapisispora phaffii CBS 4417]